MLEQFFNRKKLGAHEMSLAKEIWIRIFPSNNQDLENVKLDEKQKIIHVRSLEDVGRKTLPNNLYWQFKAHGIFQNVSQEEIYEKIFTRSLKEKIFEGFDLTLLAFGCSGTGKTYTLSGLDVKYENRGITSRLLEYLFCTKKESPFHDISVSLTFVEIVGKDLYNLLQKGKPKIDNIVKVQPTDVHSLCKGLELIFKGNCQRKIENVNTHCGTSVLTILVTTSPRSYSDPTITKSKIHIVDTPGVEFGRSASKSMKCHNDANLIKCQLNTICSWTKWDLTERVPNWRASKLACYLGKSLQNGYIRFLGHINITADNIPGTLSTLLFGMRLIKLPYPKLVQAKMREPDAIIKHLQNQIIELKGSEIVDEYKQGIYRPEIVSQNQMKHTIQLVKSFLKSEISENYITGIAHPQILIQIFKDIYKSTIYEMNSIKESLETLRVEHETWLQKGLEVDLRSRTSRKRTSSTSIRSKRKVVDPKKKSASSKTPDDLDAVSLPIRTEDQPNGFRPNYDYSKLSLENEEAGERNFEKVFSETISGNNESKIRINMYKEDIEENCRIKMETMKEMINIRYKLNNIRISLEDEKWKSVIKPTEKKYDCYGKGRSTQEAILKVEEDELKRKFNEARQKAMNAHNTYIAASKALNEEIAQTDAYLCDYSQKIYNSSLILPPMDAFKGIMEKTDVQNELLNETEKCYEALRRKY